MSKYEDYIRSQLAEGEELVSLVPAYMSRAKVPVRLGLTSQRLFIVTRNLKRGDTRPLRSYRYGSELTRGRDPFFRPKIVMQGRGDHDEMRFVFPWRRANEMKQIVGALSDRPLRMR